MTLNEFATMYRECLEQAYDANPGEFAYPRDDIPIIAARIIRAMRVKGPGSVCISNSPAFRLMAKRLGIKFGVKRIEDAFRATTCDNSYVDPFDDPAWVAKHKRGAPAFTIGQPAQ